MPLHSPSRIETALRITSTKQKKKPKLGELNITSTVGSHKVELCQQRPGGCLLPHLIRWPWVWCTERRYLVPGCLPWCDDFTSNEAQPSPSTSIVGSKGLCVCVCVCVVDWIRGGCRREMGRLESECLWGEAGRGQMLDSLRGRSITVPWGPFWAVARRGVFRLGQHI